MTWAPPPVPGLSFYRLIDSNKIMAVGGPQSDCHTFGEYIEKNLTLYALENEVSLTTKATANFVRHELAKVCMHFHRDIFHCCNSVRVYVRTSIWVVIKPFTTTDNRYISKKTHTVEAHDRL